MFLSPMICQNYKIIMLHRKLADRKDNKIAMLPLLFPTSAVHKKSHLAKGAQMYLIRGLYVMQYICRLVGDSDEANKHVIGIWPVPMIEQNRTNHSPSPKLNPKYLMQVIKLQLITGINKSH